MSYSGWMKSSGRRVLEQYKEAINWIMMQCCFKCNRWQLFVTLHSDDLLKYCSELHLLLIKAVLCVLVRVCGLVCSMLWRFSSVDCWPVTTLETTWSSLCGPLGTGTCPLATPQFRLCILFVIFYMMKHYSDFAMLHRELMLVVTGILCLPCLYNHVVFHD